MAASLSTTKRGYVPTYWVIFLTGAKHFSRSNEIVHSGVRACAFDLGAIRNISWLLAAAKDGPHSNLFPVFLPCWVPGALGQETDGYCR